MFSALFKKLFGQIDSAAEQCKQDIPLVTITYDTSSAESLLSDFGSILAHFKSAQFIKHASRFRLETNEIDPLALSHEQGLFLGRVLNECVRSGKPLYFPRGLNRFQFTGADQKQKIEITLNLRYPLVWRVCEGNPCDYRFEIIGNKLGSGHYGTVYKSKGSLSPQSDGGLKLKPSNRIIKEQIHNDEYPSKKAEDEYEAGKRTPHLHVKKPTFTDNGKRSFSVLRYFRGNELFSLLVKDSKQNIFNADQRLMLSLMILRAIKKQISDRGIVHRDIKPENIIVYLDNQFNPVEVNIIDVGVSKLDPSAIEHEKVGTPLYAAPEIFEMTGSNQGTDIYSTAKVIGLIWRSKPPDIYVSNDPSSPCDLKKAYQASLTCLFENLFNNIHDLDSSHKIQIGRLLKKMTVHDKDLRITIEDAISVFEEIIFARKYSSSHSEWMVELFNAHIHAARLRKKVAGDLLDQIMMLVNNLGEELECIHDSPEIISEFLDTLGVEILRGMTTKSDIVKKITNTFEFYLDNVKRLEKLEKKLKCLSDAIRQQDRHGDMAKELSRQAVIINHLLETGKLRIVTLDDLAVMANKYAKAAEKAVALMAEVDFRQLPLSEIRNLNELKSSSGKFCNDKQSGSLVVGRSIFAYSGDPEPRMLTPQSRGCSKSEPRYKCR
jgi:serine/threonine protein kinase